jgi:hypothetical protein
LDSLKQKISLVLVKRFLVITDVPALMEMKSPQLQKIVFIALKKRPKEALFRAYKNIF